MIKNKDKEPVNPSWGSRKGVKPCWNSFEYSRRYWRKYGFFRGKPFGKAPFKKRRKWSRDKPDLNQEQEIN